MNADRNNNDLSRFRYSCPAWWEGFTRGREGERRMAIGELANWQERDWDRARIKQGVDA